MKPLRQTNYKDGVSIRGNNKRITVFKNKENPAKINVLLQAVLPKDELSIDHSRIVRGQFKATWFAISREGACALFHALGHYLTNNDRNDAVSDTTGDDSSTKAD